MFEPELAVVANHSNTMQVTNPGCDYKSEGADFVISGEWRTGLSVAIPKGRPCLCGLDRVKADVVMQVASSATCD